MDFVDDAEVSDADPISFFNRKHGASRRALVNGEVVDNLVSLVMLVAAMVTLNNTTTTYD